MNEKTQKQPIKLPLVLRRKLERIAKSQHCSMNDVVIRLIDEAPDPAIVKKAIQE